MVLNNVCIQGLCLPVRSFQDAWGEEAHRQLRNVFGPAASDQNALFSSILPSCSGTTPAKRKGMDVTKKQMADGLVWEKNCYICARCLVLKGTILFVC